MLKFLAAAIVAVGALLNSPTMPSAAEVDPEERRMFALNLYHEARNEGREGMIAVGWVVLNRLVDDEYPSDIVGVITQKSGRYCQWGWWCDGRSDEPTEAGMWELAQSVADELLSESAPADPTDGALWFQESFRERQSWMGDHVVLKVELGKHHFYGRR